MNIQEHLTTLGKLVEENNEHKETRTPYLDVMRGALRTALEQGKSHVKELERLAKKAEPAATAEQAAPAAPASDNAPGK